MSGKITLTKSELKVILESLAASRRRARRLMDKIHDPNNKEDLEAKGNRISELHYKIRQLMKEVY